MNLRAWVDKSPMVAAACIAISSAAVTFAVTGYSHSQSTEGLRRENAVFSNQLKERLAGIERRVGTGEQTFFDVSRLIIPASSIGSLGAAYRNIADGAVFVDVPADGDWRYSLTSESAMISAMFHGAVNPQIANPLLLERNVHVWRQPNSITFSSTIGRVTFFPMVMLQVVDNRRFESAFTRMAMGTEAPLFETSERATQRALDRLAHNDASAQQSTIQLRNTAEPERMLSNLFRGNIPTMLLLSTVQGNMALGAVIPNARSEIVAIEKRGNVIYVQSRMAIGGNSQSPSQDAPGVVVTETFIVTTPARTVLVRSIIPTRDGRSDAFQWVTRFLAGLRIPSED